MYSNRYEELANITTTINKIAENTNVLKNNIDCSSSTLSSELIKHIENKLNINIENVNELKNPFTLLIMGSGNYGKSTLINALLKQVIVKTNDIPNTWKLDLFIKSSKEQAIITYKDRSKKRKNIKCTYNILKQEEDKFKKSKEYINQELIKYKQTNKYSKSDLKKQKSNLEKIHLYNSDIIEVAYYLNEGEILTDFTLVDTPGFNQVLLKKPASRIKEYYIKSDGIIWMIDAQNIISRESNKLLEEIKEIDNLKVNKKIIGVVNKIDIVSMLGDEKLDKIKQKVNEIYNNKFDDIVYVSAKQAIDGIKNDDYNLIKKSNINDLYKSINENFKLECEQKQIKSKYKNLFVLKEDLLYKIYEYKKQLYKDISIYYEAETILSEKRKDIIKDIDIFIKNISHKDIEQIQEDIKCLECKINIQIKKLHNTLSEKLYLEENESLNNIQTTVYLSRLKSLLPRYKTIQPTNQDNRKINALNIVLKKHSSKYKNDKLQNKNLRMQDIDNIYSEIIQNIKDKTNIIEDELLRRKQKNFENKYLKVEYLKEHIDNLNNIENIINKLG